MPGRIARLIMVTPTNNNKFYNMEEHDDGSISVHYGRVGQTGTHRSYGRYERSWESLHNSKTKKGYKDHTELRADNPVSTVEFIDISEPVVASIVNTLQQFSRKTVQQNYTVSSEAVTPQMVAEAQRLVDLLVDLIPKSQKGINPFNESLIGLFGVIPRKMGKVANFLLPPDAFAQATKEHAQKLVSSEQDLLDVMQGQVVTHTATKDNKDTKKTLLDAMGIEIIVPTAKDITTVKKSLSRESANLFSRCFRIHNIKTQKKFDAWIDKAKNKKIKQFWHGSRNENWWSILESGLLIRPAGAIATGSMFGNGVYFADRAKKSIGYTSMHGSYWARGGSDTGYLSLYDVHVGNMFEVNRSRSNMNWKRLKDEGDFDSLYAKKGAGLYNNEYIIYKIDQCTVQYLVEIKS